MSSKGFCIRQNLVDANGAIIISVSDLAFNLVSSEQKEFKGFWRKTHLVFSMKMWVMQKKPRTILKIRALSGDHKISAAGWAKYINRFQKMPVLNLGKSPGSLNQLFTKRMSSCRTLSCLFRLWSSFSGAKLANSPSPSLSARPWWIEPGLILLPLSPVSGRVYWWGEEGRQVRKARTSRSGAEVSKADRAERSRV